MTMSGSKHLKSVIIAGGGTGGHIYPGVAIADEVRRRNPDATIVFIGTERGLETKLVPKAGYPLETIRVSRLKGGGILGKLKGLFLLPFAIIQSWLLLRRYRPDVVVGVGGYASGPALLAAWLTCRKTSIQEQNATPGMTNSFLGKVVKRVFIGFEAGAKSFPVKKTHFTGNPVRQSILDRLQATELQTDADTFSVLVFGGSQGARFLNEKVPALLASLRDQGIKLRIRHQTGENAVEATQTRYQELQLQAEVLPFIDDMPRAYGEADFAICRAGALTIAELTAVGLPSLLVPFPLAADNHQEANARDLESHGGCLVAPESGWDMPHLSQKLAALANNRPQLVAMSQAAHTRARTDAAQTIVTALEELCA